MRKREREAAGPLYIEQQKTLEEIARDLDVAERTLRYWKEKDKWDEKRDAYLEKHTRSVEAFEQLIDDLAKEIAADRKRGRRPSDSRLNTLSGLQKRLDGLRAQGRKKTEELAEAEEDKKPPLTLEHYLQIEQELFGLYADSKRN